MDEGRFLRMAREYPVRTCIFTFGLPAFALLQLVNGVVNEGELAYILGFAAVAVGMSVVLTRYQLATYRRDRLNERWLQEE